MQHADLILTLTAGLAAALGLGYVALRLRLPPIVGYLVAGMLLGPHTPGFVANREIASQLAEIGVILLMFGVGLHFHLKDLVAVRGVAVTGALVQIATATLLGALATRALGWSWTAGAVFAVALSVASTVVLIRVLTENRDLQSQTGRIAIGWLVVEDIFTVLVLVILSSGSATGSLPWIVGVAVLKLGVLSALTLIAGGRFIPRLLGGVAKTNSRELFTLTVLVIALGIAVGSSMLFGVSMALGAFLAGMVVGQSEFTHRAASEALPMRDAFAVLFFISVGMLFDPAHLMRAPLLTLITVLIVMIGKPVAAFAIVLLLGYGAHIGLRVSVALAQIGEFSFIVAALGDQLGILPDGATDSLIAAAIVSITLNPLLYRAACGADRVLMGSARLRRIFAPKGGKGTDPVEASAYRAIVVGYGPIGQSASKLLRERGIEPTIIELNIDTVRQLTAEGTHAVYGDAAQPNVLEEAGISSAVAFVFSARTGAESEETVRVVRQAKADIHILVRAAFVSEAPLLEHAGADQVFSGEAEVALAMTEAILRHLGATPDQVDYERARVRGELYGASGPPSR